LSRGRTITTFGAAPLPLAPCTRQDMDAERLRNAARRPVSRFGFTCLVEWAKRTAASGLPARQLHPARPDEP
jgi:hypothetical protein